MNLNLIEIRDDLCPFHEPTTGTDYSEIAYKPVQVKSRNWSLSSIIAATANENRFGAEGVAAHSFPYLIIMPLCARHTHSAEIPSHLFGFPQRANLLIMFRLIVITFARPVRCRHLYRSFVHIGIERKLEHISHSHTHE